MNSQQAADRAPAANQSAEFYALTLDPAAIALVRAGQRREDRPLKVVLMCSGHRTGVSMALVIDDEVGSDEDWRRVPEHILMYAVKDINGPDGAFGNGDPSFTSEARSYTIVCGTCDRQIRRQNVKLLREALKCIVESRQGQKGGYRISIT